MERKKVKKDLNYMRFEEKQIYSPEYMNAILGDKDRIALSVSEERKSFVTAVNKVTKKAFSFSLFGDEIVYYQDIKHITAVANGWFTHVKRLTFKDHDINGKGVEVDGPCQRLDPSDFPNIKFKYLDQSIIEGVTCLDLNSAYLSVLAKGYYPNLDKKREDGFVKEGEIGFTNWTGVLKMVKVGEYAETIFEIGYSKELVKWAKDKYAHLCLLKAQNKRNEADDFKASITRMTGVIKNHNPYLYVYIVGTCKQKIFELVDENCINVVTDAIYFVGKVKPGLDIGTKLGQFKVEFEDCIYYRPTLNTNVCVKDRNGNIVKISFRGGSTPKDSIEGFNDENKTFNFREQKYKIIGDFIYG